MGKQIDSIKEFLSSVENASLNEIHTAVGGNKDSMRGSINLEVKKEKGSIKRVSRGVYSLN